MSTILGMVTSTNYTRSSYGRIYAVHSLKRQLLMPDSANVYKSAWHQWWVTVSFRRGQSCIMWTQP